MANQIIHIGSRAAQKIQRQYLLLRKAAPNNFTWFAADNSHESDTQISAPTIEESLRLAHRTWNDQNFKTVMCGFRYTMPERDEHGTNALFFEMAASYLSPTGVYFDEHLGHLCHVQNASQEALSLMKRFS